MGGFGTSSAFIKRIDCHDSNQPCASSSSKQQYCRLLHVHTLTKQNLAVCVHVKCQVVNVFSWCCQQTEIIDGRLLGLAIRSPAEGIIADIPRHEYFFLDPAMRLSKYAAKAWKSAQNWSTENRPFLTLYLRVRTYIDHVPLIRSDSVALFHYYLQLRENLLDQWAGSNSVSEERCWELAALAIQADRKENEAMEAIRSEHYFPLWLINMRGLEYIRENMSNILDDVKHLSRSNAMITFCQAASRAPYALNNHLYGLRRRKADTEDTALLGIGPRGVEMWSQGEERVLLRGTSWSRIARLSFDRRRLSMEAVDGFRLHLYAQTDGRARYLFEFCRSVHQQLMLLQPDIQKLLSSLSVPGEEDGLEMSTTTTTVMPGYQRRSIASDVSSNSTSGIVSDRHQSDAEKDFDADSRTQSVIHMVGFGFGSSPSGEQFTSSIDEQMKHRQREREGSLQDSLGLSEEQTVTTTGSEGENYSQRSEDSSSDQRTITRENRRRGERWRMNDDGDHTRRRQSESSTNQPHSTTTHIFRVVSAQHSHNNKHKDLDLGIPAKKSIETPPALVQLNATMSPSNLIPPSTHIAMQRPDYIWYNWPNEAMRVEHHQNEHGQRQPGANSQVEHGQNEHGHGQRQPGTNSQVEHGQRQPCTNSHYRPVRPRWTTVAGIDSGLMAELERQQQQRSIQAHSESRLYDQSHLGVTSIGDHPARLQAQRISPEPNSRGINRVQSMPAHSPIHLPIAFAIEPSRAKSRTETTPVRSLQHAQSMLEHGGRQPPSYERAIQLQQARALANCPPPPGPPPPGKRHSLGSGQQTNMLRNLNEYPIMRALWQESQSTAQLWPEENRLSSAIAAAFGALPNTASNNNHSVRPVLDLPPPPPYPQTKTTSSTPRTLVI